MLRRRFPGWTGPLGDLPARRYSGAGTAREPPARGIATQVAHQGPTVKRPDLDPSALPAMPAALWIRSNLQPRGKPRAPPLRLDFFSRLSYWCDIRCAWIWEMKSITTTTTISSDVPPK